MELWVPYYIAHWQSPYWQCATPTGPYNFQAKDEFEAFAICERERQSRASREPSP